MMRICVDGSLLFIVDALPNLSNKAFLELDSQDGNIASWIAKHTTAKRIVLSSSGIGRDNCLRKKFEQFGNSRICIIQSKGFSNITEKFDVIVSKIPVSRTVFSPSQLVFECRTFLSEVRAHLKDRGRAYLEFKDSKIGSVLDFLILSTNRVVSFYDMQEETCYVFEVTKTP